MRAGFAPNNTHERSHEHIHTHTLTHSHMLSLSLLRSFTRSFALSLARSLDLVLSRSLLSPSPSRPLRKIVNASAISIAPEGPTELMERSREVRVGLRMPMWTRGAHALQVRETEMAKRWTMPRHQLCQDHTVPCIICPCAALVQKMRTRPALAERVDECLEQRSPVL